LPLGLLAIVLVLKNATVPLLTLPRPMVLFVTIAVAAAVLVLRGRKAADGN
jgi:hypothetical protein